MRVCRNAIKVCLLQCGSESNSVAIYQLNLKIGNFLPSDWDFFFENQEKRRIFWIGNGA